MVPEAAIRSISMSIRFVYPFVTSTGLGNNIIALARAHLIAESCQMTYQAPIWPPCEHVKPPTPNGYGYYFPTTLADKLKIKLTLFQRRVQGKSHVQLWPILLFGANDYKQIGVVDVGEACRVYLRNRGLDDPAKSVVVITGKGMWGGYAGIGRACAWINDLFMSHADTRRRLAEIERGTDGRLRIAVHIRIGDFQPRGSAGPMRGGERGVRLPLDWYARICCLIRDVCDCEFILVTDGTHEELLPFLKEFNPVNTLGQPYQDLLGALLMSRSDLVICSNSTYCRLGVFLNDKPYIWCADTLVKDLSGRFGYLWKDGGNPVPDAGRSDPDAIRRCFALSSNFSTLPGGLKRYLESSGTLSIEIPDDLLYRDPVYLM